MDFRTLIACFWVWWDKGQKMFAAHQTTGDKTRKTPQKKRKKPAKNRKSWIFVVLGSFRIFLVVPKIITVCVPGRSAEIFPETYMFGTKWIIFWFVWPIFLERPFFPRQWRVEEYMTTWMGKWLSTLIMKWDWGSLFSTKSRELMYFSPNSVSTLRGSYSIGVKAGAWSERSSWARHFSSISV